MHGSWRLAPTTFEVILAGSLQEPLSEDAFSRFYRANISRVYLLALRLTRDPTDAAEVSADVFVRAWRGYSQFRGDSSDATWLHTIVVRSCVDLQRSRQRRIAILPEALLDETDAARYSSAAQYAPHDERLDLEAAIAQLPDGAREVLVLFSIMGHSHAEVADLLGVATGTVKSQLHRARRLLLNALNR